MLMLEIRYAGLPLILIGLAHPPEAVNANRGSQPAIEPGVPDFPVKGLLWAPPRVWQKAHASSRRHYLTVVK